ncbi:CNH domain-containing protein [Mycena epipterygia]|nr:CNH domain-containing protein [Mycena epipterygia]
MDRIKLFEFASLAVLKSPKFKPLTCVNSFSDTDSTEFPAAPVLHPLTDQALPTEIFERIIDFLHADKNALISCSTVCRSWFPTSRYHLYTLLPIIPVSLREGCHKVNTAITFSGDSLLYGTNNGVYLSRNRTLVRVLKLPAVSQIDALATHDLLLILSGRRLLVAPLHLATGNNINPELFYRRLALLSSDASFFQVGDHGGNHVVCVVHTGRFSSHFKLLEVVDAPPGGTHTLKLFHSFYLPDHARSVHIYNKTIGVGLRTGFLCVDPLSLITFNVPVTPDPPPADDESRKCRAMFRLGNRFLLCYDRIAFFMDKAGASSEHTFAIRWSDPAKQFAVHFPYLLAFMGTGMQAWRIDSGVLVQAVRGSGIRLLATAPRILVKLGDGRVVALEQGVAT